MIWIRYSSIEFTVQLQDEDGNALEREGVEIEVEVTSREIVVDAEADVKGVPTPEITYDGRRSSTDTTVLTDRRGEAAFDLDGPSNDERLDSIIFSAECCSERESRSLGATVTPFWLRRDPISISINLVPAEGRSSSLSNTTCTISTEPRCVTSILAIRDGRGK